MEMVMRKREFTRPWLQAEGREGEVRSTLEGNIMFTCGRRDESFGVGRRTT